MRFRTREAESDAEVAMAPLIDCVFILLIFFLVTSMLQKPHRDLGLVLPNAVSVKQATAQYDTIIIEMTAGRPPHGDPLIVVDSEEMTTTLLHRRLREMMIRDPNRRARLDADREVAVEHVSRMLDLLQFEGVKDIGIRTMD